MEQRELMMPSFESEGSELRFQLNQTNAIKETHMELKTNPGDTNMRKQPAKEIQNQTTHKINFWARTAFLASAT